MFQPIKIASRKQVLYETLKEAIFAGKLKPGDSLKELHLARDFDVSQATVREALLQLEHVGLLAKIPNKGTIVKTISQREIRERNEVRIRLEEMASINAMSKLKDQDFDALNNYVLKMREAISLNQPLVFTKTDLEFHQYIWKKSRNEILFDTLTRIVTPLFYISYNVQQIRDLSKIPDLPTLHEDYLKSLRSHDEAQIKSAIHGHINKMYKPML